MSTTVAIALIVELTFLDVAIIYATVKGARTWEGVLAKIIDREKAMDVHAKAVTQQALIATASAERTVETAKRSVDDARVIRERVDVFLNDPRLQKLIADG